MKKRVLSCFMALVMMLSLLPMSVLAALGETQASSVSTDSESPIQITKSVSEDGRKITMEAYAKNTVTTTTKTEPLDIVLVLDVSGSMNDPFSDSSNRLSALKNSVRSFIDSVQKNAAESDVNHRIGIVKFASDKKNTVGNETYFGNRNYSQIVKELTDASNAPELESAVNGLRHGGATRADFGMEKAEEALKDGREEAKKVVIMFTDGSTTSSNGFEMQVADDAIKRARDLKNRGVAVYTIGIFEGADPSDTEAPTNAYMNGVSSNYPEAEGYINLGTRVVGDYYFAASDAASLNQVFQKISEEISSLKVNPDANSVLSDILSPYFAFPENATDDVQVSKVRVAGKNGDNYTWGESEDITDRVTVNVTVDGNDKTISVTGFDYKENAVTEKTVNGETEYSGAKLVITFPIEADTSYTQWEEGKKYYPTNQAASMTYKNESDDQAETKLNDSPSVPVTAYKVTYEWDNAPEGAPTPPADGKYYIQGQSYSVDSTQYNPIEKKDTYGNVNGRYTFSGWKVNGEGEVVTGEQAMGTSDVTLKGEWTHTSVAVETHRVTYDPNGGRGTMNDGNSPYVAGSEVTVLKNKFYRSHYRFLYWTTNKDGTGTRYHAGDTFNINANTTLYAQWRHTGGGGGDVKPPVLDTKNHYGYIVGYTDDTVRPNGDITRAEVATIFFRLLTDESRDQYWSQTNSFTDVAADQWYNNAISTLTNAGILDGYEDGTFRPNGKITRAEFATIAVRFFDLSYEGKDLFPDIANHWAREYINQAASAGFVNGYEDGAFRPDNPITRAEAVTLVNRTLKRKPHKHHMLDNMKMWSDNMDKTVWYYEAIQEATNSHEYYMEKNDQGVEYEIWTKILPMRDWPALEKEWSQSNGGK